MLTAKTRVAPKSLFIPQPLVERTNWLEKNEDYWSKAESIEENQPAVNNEVQTLKQTTMVVTHKNNLIVQLINQISSFRKLVRIFLLWQKIHSEG